MQHAKLCLAVASLLATTTTQLRAQTFEGVTQFVNYESANSEHPDTITQIVKGMKTRMEGVGHGSTLIMTADKMYMIDTPNKQYVEAPLDAKDVAEMSTGKKGSATKTGKTESVAGITCEDWHYKATNDDGEAEEGDACIAKGAGVMMGNMAKGGMMKMLTEGGTAFNDALHSGSGIMKATTNGKVTLLVIKSKASPIPDAMFVPPAGFKKVGG
jgi:hypothetical protein